jgi:hypothetical protein
VACQTGDSSHPARYLSAALLSTSTCAPNVVTLDVVQGVGREIGPVLGPFISGKTQRIEIGPVLGRFISGKNAAQSSPLLPFRSTPPASVVGCARSFTASSMRSGNDRSTSPRCASAASIRLPVSELERRLPARRTGSQRPNGASNPPQFSRALSSPSPRGARQPHAGMRTMGLIVAPDAWSSTAWLIDARS